MSKLPKRPIDAKDMPWSYIGKDALDAAAERVWSTMVEGALLYPKGSRYHIATSREQEVVQHVVLDVIGTTVPALLRQRAKEIRKNGASIEEADVLFDLADELDADHS